MALIRRNPIWPYLLVLACLFGLSIAAPRGWQRSGTENRSDDLSRHVPPQADRAPVAAQVVRPTTVVDLSTVQPDPAGTKLPPFAETKPKFEDPAEKIAENHRFDAGAELRAKPQETAPSDNPLWPAEPKADPPATESTPPSPTTTSEPNAGPMPPPAPMVSSPTATATEPTLAPPQAPAVEPTTTVQRPNEPGLPLVEAVVPTPQPPNRSEPSPLPESVGQTAPSEPAPRANSGWPLARALLARLETVGHCDVCRQWSEHVLEELRQLNQLGPQECSEARSILERLRRLVGEAESLIPKLHDQSAMAELRRTQYAIVRRLDVWDQVCTIRRRTASSTAAEGTDGLLTALERYEADGLASDAQRLAEIRRELLSSPEPDEQELARRLNTHFRNANLRFAVSAALVNKLMPEQKASSDQVNDTILGNPVRGNSTATTKLSVRLVPDPRKWQFDLVAAGNVDSNTQTTHGPVTFINTGAATYQVRKRVAIDTSGMKVDGAVAEVENSTELAGLYTSFDSMPLIRSLVRSYAVSQEQQQEWQANHEAKMKIAAKAMRQVDSQAGPRINEAQENVVRNWVDPLKKLALDPTAMTMETTETRLVLRSRLAGGDQLGAYTPRPEAPSDSVASAQIHESTLNNVLDHLDLAGRTFTLPELHAWLVEKLNRPAAKPPEDFPEGVHVTFAQKDPIRVRCQDNKLVLILNIAEIRDARRRWHDFEVRASYKPAASGLAAQFERDGTIELGGQYKGKPEIALRGIFSKVLSRQRPLNLFSEKLAGDPRLSGLEVTQLIVEDGWIATAIGPVRTAGREPRDSTGK